MGDNWPCFLGDDLTGSAEAASTLVGLSKSPSALHLDIDDLDAGSVVVFDLDTRGCSPQTAFDRTRQVLARCEDRSVVFKIDSLLRGNIAAHVAALNPQRHCVIVAPALPAQSRAVINGRLMINNVPLTESTAVDAWTRGEQQLPPSTVAETIGDRPHTLIRQSTLRSAEMRSRVVEATARSDVVIVDSATDADLDRLISTTADIPRIRYLGSAALVAAIGRHLAVPPSNTADPMTHRPTALSPSSEQSNQSSHSNCPTRLPSGVLVVVGTIESVVGGQIQQLADRRAEVIELHPADLVSGDNFAASNIRRLLRTRTVVIRVQRTPGSNPDQVTDGLAGLVSAVAPSPSVPLVLVGGRTARSILEALGHLRLTVRDSVHHGAVVLEAEDGRHVITRPGSFGQADSLLRSVCRLGDYTARAPQTTIRS